MFFNKLLDRKRASVSLGIIVASVLIILAFPLIMDIGGITGFAIFGDDSQSDFNQGIYINTTHNGSAVILSGTNTSGNYASQIFNGSVGANWNNISWWSNYGWELPKVSEGESDIYIVNSIDTTGLVLYMNMNEQSGTIIDYSGQGNNGTSQNFDGDEYNATGKFNTSLDLDGTNDHLNLGAFTDLDGSTEFTVSMWIYPHDNNFVGHQGILSIGGLNQRTPWIWGYNGANHLTIQFETSNGETDCDADSGSVTQNQWNHIVAVFNSSHCYFYVDNVKGNVDTVVGNAIVNTDGYNHIGYIDPYAYFDGKIDELAIWNRSLSSTEIQNLYARGATRLNLSVRNCSAFDCSGASWVNKGVASSQDLSLSSQYFQYKFDFETDSASYSPELYNVTIDYTSGAPCTPNWQNDTWTSWYNISSCYINDTVDQERNITQYDDNCGEANSTHYEHQTDVCDYCTPNLQNTSWSSWTNISCLPSDTMNQTRNITQYDTSFCGGDNTTFVEYQNISYCDYCTPNLTNTSPTSWINISCLPNDKMNQSRNYTQYDANNCVGGNQTFVEYQSILDCTYIVDTDGDGVPDVNDTLEGDESDVTVSGVTALNITIGGNSTNGSFAGSQEVLFYDGTDLLMNFSHNFSAAEIDLSKVSIEITSLSIVVNMSGQLLEKKTLYIKDNSFVGLCVKDDEIASVSEISFGCTGTNETDFTSCLGNSIGVTSGSLTCYDQGSIIKVENLTYSGIKGIQAAVPPAPSSGGGGGGGKRRYQCNDKKDNDEDGLIDLDDPGCLNRYDDDESDEIIEECKERWVCEMWVGCKPDGKMHRNCSEVNECGTDVYKPKLEVECKYIIEEEVEEEKPPVEEAPVKLCRLFEQDYGLWLNMCWYLWILIFILIISSCLVIVFFNKDYIVILMHRRRVSNFVNKLSLIYKERKRYEFKLRALDVDEKLLKEKFDDFLAKLTKKQRIDLEKIYIMRLKYKKQKLEAYKTRYKKEELKAKLKISLIKKEIEYYKRLIELLKKTK